MPSAPLPPDLVSVGAACGALLRNRGETVSVAEGSAGGLISAALLATPGASAYYLGGSVIYTGRALTGMLDGLVERPSPLQGASEPWVLHLARATCAHVRSDWGVGEGGAAGPGGNPYGDPSGHGWAAAVGPEGAVRTRHTLTGLDDREANMVAFAQAALETLRDALESV